MSNTPTPHIGAEVGAFGKTVLMPGDPLRAKLVAEKFFENPILVNNVRGINGYTGIYKGMKISVMASGMGMPSMGIYSYELFNFYDVDNIIRIGSAGALNKDISLREIILGMGACTNSNYASQFGFNGTYAPIASYELLREAASVCESMKISHKVGNLLSSDTFYNDDPSANEPYIKMGVLAVEMEAAALYMNAACAGKNALAICTVSDNIITGEALPAEARQNSFTDMMEAALETALRMEQRK